MIKKIIFMGVTFIMCLGIFSGCGKYIYKESDFIFKITVEKETIQQGEDFIVGVQLKNQSGLDAKISYYYEPVIPHIDGWRYPFPSLSKPSNPELLVIQNNENYEKIWKLGGGEDIYTDEFDNAPTSLACGTYELRFSTRITIKKQEVEIYSNIITLIVI